MREEVAEKVTAILAAQALLDPSEVTPEMSVDSLGLDSLGLVESIFAIEEAFDISVPFNPNEPGADPAFDVSTVGSIISAVTALVMARAG